jgi:hypothetical protein
MQQQILHTIVSSKKVGEAPHFRAYFITSKIGGSSRLQVCSISPYFHPPFHKRKKEKVSMSQQFLIPLPFPKIKKRPS